MLYKIEKAEKKSDDWLVVTLVESATSGDNEPAKYLNVSINRKNKKGEIFPNFDDIKQGNSIEGDIWQNDSGKWYLFAPRVAKTGNSGAYKQKMIEDTMQRKEGSITKFQDNKELSIKMASTMRMAVDLAIAEYKNETVLDTLEQGIEKWRAYCWEHWDVEDKDFQAFN